MTTTMPDISLGLRRLARPVSDFHKGDDGIEIEAAQLGGRCRITGTAEQLLENLSSASLVKLRRWIWSSRRRGGRPKIDHQIIADIDEYRLPSFAEMSMDVLARLFEKTDEFGQAVLVRGQPDSLLMYELSTVACVDTGIDNEVSREPPRVSFIFRHLASQGFLDKLALERSNMAIVVTSLGIIELEKQRALQTSSTQAFVAMWFDSSTDDAWQKGFDPAVRAAGYEAFRVDQSHHPNRIDDEIIRQIRRSRFLIADFTCGRTKDGSESIVRGGVYFEAGFAHGLNLPIIWSVRRDCFEALHFDTRQYPHILWREPEDLRAQLQDRIEALLGRGPMP
jgi:hypothetical protein